MFFLELFEKSLESFMHVRWTKNLQYMFLGGNRAKHWSAQRREPPFSINSTFMDLNPFNYSSSCVYRVGHQMHQLGNASCLI